MAQVEDSQQHHDQPAAPPAAAPETPEHPEHPVELTAKAVQMIRLTRQEEGLDETHGLRVAVVGGGCSGFQYALDFTNEARSNDFVYQVEDLTIYVDAVSARYLEGVRIDYVMGTAGAGFKVCGFAWACGAGSSATRPPRRALLAPGPRSRPRGRRTRRRRSPAPACAPG
jgi:iron-sulfur cluster assembly protein